jgi:ubiquinol-cytochrome c reductase cytochrome c subunit
MTKKLTFGMLAPAAATALMVLTAQGQAAGDAAKGKQLYVDYSCYACHGFSGQNGPGTRLAPMKMSAAAFTAYVRNPRTKQMPAFSPKVISDQQLADIHAYIRTLPDSPKAEDIKLLRDIKAEVGK